MTNMPRWAFIRCVSLLLFASLLQGCDSGPSVTQFGAPPGSTTVSGEVFSTERVIEVQQEDLETNEYSSSVFDFETAATAVAYIWMDAELISGPDVEIFFLGEDNHDEWIAHYEAGLPLEDFAFGSTYPQLENVLTGDSLLETEKIIVTSGEYVVLVENTDAGNMVADTGTEPSVFDLRVYVQLLSTAGDEGEVRLISTSKVKIGG